ncbi:MAG: hypothetical protein IKL97_06705, partial [Eggerthellaceae bacterium]|nr:hypothetical protein [Eggerthellaceae bacterium]
MRNCPNFTETPVPSLPEAAVSRSHLATLLEEALRRAAIVVVAPLGYGKTTLVAEWADLLGKRGTATLHYIDLEEERADFDFFCETVARLAEEAPTEKDVLMCLDGYDAVTDERVHAALGRMMLRFPAHVHWLIICESEPPLPISKLFGAGRLLMVDECDLRFSEEECQAYLGLLAGSGKITEFDENDLIARTEGWPLAMRELGLRLKRVEGPSSVGSSAIASAGIGLNRLFDEAIASVPERARTLIPFVSVLDRFCEPLCESVLRSCARTLGIASDEIDSKVHAVCEALITPRQGRLHVLPDGGRGAWFRFHPLFRDYLRRKLKEGFEPAVRAAHAAAGEWLYGRVNRDRFLEDAVKHFVLACEWDRACALIEQHSWTLVSQGKAGAVVEWMSLFPQEQALSHPSLYLVFLFTAAMKWNGGPRSFEQQYRRLTEGPDAAERIQSDAEVRALLGAPVDASPSAHPDPRGTIARTSGFLEGMADGQLKAVLLLDVAFAHLSILETGKARQRLAECRRISCDSSVVCSLAIASYCETMLLAAEGSVEAAREACRRGRIQCLDILGEWQTSSPMSRIFDAAEGRLLLVRN